MSLPRRSEVAGRFLGRGAEVLAWAYGARDLVVDGIVVSGDPRRNTGLCRNPAVRLEPALKNVCAPF